MTLFDFLSVKNDVNVPSKSNKQNFFFKKLVFCWHLEGQWRKKAGSGSRIRIQIHYSEAWIPGPGSISQRHGSPDPAPDPHQNVMDPQHWLCQLSIPSFEWFERLTANANVAIVRSSNTKEINSIAPTFLRIAKATYVWKTRQITLKRSNTQQINHFYINFLYVRYRYRRRPLLFTSHCTVL